MNITETSAGAFDIEFPEINSVHTHMLGSDMHSIAAGREHADAFIKQPEAFIEKNYALILSSHRVPENPEDVKRKIEYVKIKKNGAGKQNRRRV